jgi:uncharacterized protein YyaL (SSP411 family)
MGPSCRSAASSDDDPAGKYLAAAGESMAVLLRWYRPSTGRWRTAGWWNAANVLTTTVDYAALADSVAVADLAATTNDSAPNDGAASTGDPAATTGSGPWRDLIATTFDRNRRRHRQAFRNDFYDDAGWWALAWLRAWDLTRDDRYLDVARVIFADLLEAWDDTCGGGIWWSRARDYKNAISNELFLSIAVGLHLRVPSAGSYYLDWATRSWDWFAASGMRNGHGLVNDGLRDCVNNGEPTWTYNQGVILGGLASLYQATGDAALLREAETIADAAIITLVDEHGILADLHARFDRDQVTFKGVFARNLATLHEATGHDRYTTFLRHNADAILTSARDPAGRLAFNWSGPPTKINAATHAAALDAIIAAAKTTRPTPGPSPQAPGPT